MRMKGACACGKRCGKRCGNRGALAGHRKACMKRKAVVQFMDLPLEMRTLVYERLHVMDRARFNLAVPPRFRDTGTAVRDRRLRLLWHLFQRRALAPARLPVEVVRFMFQHRADPTVAGLVRDHGVVLTDVHPFVFGDGDAITADDVARLPDEVVQSAAFGARLVGLIRERMTPALYETLTGDPRVRRVFLTNDMHSNLVFSAINQRNYALLEYFAAREGEDEVLRRSFAFMRRPAIACIFAHTTEQTAAMLRFCRLPEVAKSRVLDEAVKRFNNDSLMAAVLADLRKYV